jgi:hypothetical protein
MRWSRRVTWVRYLLAFLQKTNGCDDHASYSPPKDVGSNNHITRNISKLRMILGANDNLRPIFEWSNFGWNTVLSLASHDYYVPLAVLLLARHVLGFEHALGDSGAVSHVLLQHWSR